MKRGNRAQISRLSSRATRPGCKLANYQHLKYGLPATNSLFPLPGFFASIKGERQWESGFESRDRRIEETRDLRRQQTHIRRTHFDLSFSQRQCTLCCTLKRGSGGGKGIHTCPLLNARIVPL